MFHLHCGQTALSCIACWQCLILCLSHSGMWHSSLTCIACWHCLPLCLLRSHLPGLQQQFISHLHVLLARWQSVPDTVCPVSLAARLHLCGGEAAYVRRPPGCAAVGWPGLVPCRQRGQQVGSQVTGSPFAVQSNAVQRKNVARVLFLAHLARPTIACPDQRVEGLVDGCMAAFCLHRHAMPERKTQLLTQSPVMSSVSPR